MDRLPGPGQTEDEPVGESFASLVRNPGSKKNTATSSFASLVRGPSDLSVDNRAFQKNPQESDNSDASADIESKTTRTGSRKKTRASTKSRTKKIAKAKATRASTKSGDHKKRRTSTKPGGKIIHQSKFDAENVLVPDSLVGSNSIESVALPSVAAAAIDPAERYETTVVVFENGASNQKRVVDVVARLGYAAIDSRRDETTLHHLLDLPTPPDLVIVGLPSGIQVLQDIRKRCGDSLIIATLPGPAESARQRALDVGADLFIVRPHTKDSLAVVLLAAESLLRSRRELNAALASFSIVKTTDAQSPWPDRIQRGERDEPSSTPSLKFFERIVIMEIKRAKRFGYSLASALVGFEGPHSSEFIASSSLSNGDLKPLREHVVARLRERVAIAIRANIRDIDLFVDYADGRTLLFLPYADLEGANNVGHRVAEAVRQLGRVEVDGRSYSCSVSVGISAVRPGTPVSFARLMKDAKQALRAAQLKGGGQVVVRR